MTARHVIAVCGLFLFGTGCSFVDPKAGALQAACGVGSGSGGQNGSGTGYAVPVPDPTTGTDTCQSTTAGSCDECEAMNCCATRSDCFGDPVCACADASLDACLDTAATAASADQPAQVSRCWSNFSAKGTVEQARVTCERSWCQAVCGVP